MKLSRIALPFVAATLLFSAGCASHPYYYAPGPPPPPYSGAPSLLERAQHEGFRVGTSDGARDAYDRRGYHPKRNPAFRSAQGPYRDAFRGAYLQGYDQGFRRR